jgi:hypothetical protein
LAGFGWIWLDLAGFGWIWLDLAGFGWIWLDLAGFKKSNLIEVEHKNKLILNCIPTGWIWLDFPDQSSQIQPVGIQFENDTLCLNLKLNRIRV